MNKLVKCFLVFVLVVMSAVLAIAGGNDSVKMIRVVNAKQEIGKQDLRLNNAKKKNDKLEIIKSYFSLGACYQVLGYYDSSQTYFDSTLKTIGDNNGKPNDLFVDALKRSGDNMMFKGEFSEALNKYNEVIDLEKSSNSKSQYVGKAYKSMASVYQKMGSLSEALEHALKALEIIENGDDKLEMANITNELGIIYKKLKYYEKAISFFKKSIKIKQALNNEIGLSSTYQNIGSVYSRQENYGLAIEYFNKSLELKNKYNIVKGLASVYVNIGLVYKRKKEFKKAESYYFKALKIAEKTKSKNYQFTALNNISSLFLTIEKPELAKEYGKQALAIAKETGSFDNLSYANYNLYEAYTLIGDYKKALHYYVEYNKNEDSISNKRTIAKIERLEKEIALKEKDKELILKDKELEFSKIKQDLSRTRNAMLLIGFLLVASVLIWLLYFRNKQNKTRLAIIEADNNALQLAHEQIEQKLRYEKLSKEHYLAKLENQELQTSTRSLEVSQLEKDIEKLKNQIVSNKTKENKSLAETIIQMGKSEKDWTLFMNYFQEVYHDFHKNLITDYPNLTPHELRLCALLKINLSTKEIADILNISPASLRTSKYRLRKKLQLDEDINVQEFILKY